MSFLEKTKKVLLIKELRNRLLYTLCCCTVYRLGTYILLPHLNPETVLATMQKTKESSMWDRLLGTSLDTHSLFLLGISPYITASIVVQFCGFSIPYFQQLQQEGQAGRAQLKKITRQLTVLMAIGQAIPNVFNIQTNFILGSDQWGAYWFYVTSILLITASSMFCVWLADSITEKGLGNGTSVLIMVGIIAKLPQAIIVEFTNVNQTILFLIIELIILFFIILAIIIFMQAVRQILLQYAKQMANSSLAFGGKRQYLPIKMNMTGVMPVIFASTFVRIISFLAKILKDKSTIAKTIAEALKDSLNWQFNLCLAILIVIGTFTYASLFVNPIEIANQLKQSGGFISGVKPGRPTAHYIDTIISRVILPGALFLAIITMIPSIAAWEKIGISREFSGFYGGTSLIIIIGVILDMVEAIEGHLTMNQYNSLNHGDHYQDIPDA